MKISASILAAELISLKNTLTTFSETAIDLIHIDVMDGNFVPQISFGEAITKEIKKATSIPLDVHLMVSHPEAHAPKYYELKPYCITFHVETTHFGVRLSEEIKSTGAKVGITCNPGTPISQLEPLLPYVDQVLVMTVDPGFYGQAFVKNGLEKIRNVASLLKGTNISLEVDGGVNESNFVALAQAGVDICVIGSALFRGGNPNSKALEFKKLLSSP